jgi:CRP-like cAMP-binding protein
LGIPAGFDLRRVPLFNGLNGCDLTNLLGRASQKNVARGSYFFHERDDAAHCHLLVSGRVKLVQAGDDGGQLITRFVGPGEMFGWAQVLGAPAYPGSAQAMAECVSLTWDAAAIRVALLGSSRMAVNALELLGARLHETQDRLRELATERVERRLARALLRLAAQSGRELGDGAIEVGFPVSRQDLAEITGATLHTVSRILALWEQGGLVGGKRQKVILVRPDRLEAMAEDRPETGAF